MPQPKVLVGSEPQRRREVRLWGDDATYRVVAWGGVVLALAALSDYTLAFYPPGFGSAEWEMATIGSVMQGLPLLSIGLAAMWVGGARLGRRWMLVTVGWAVLAVAVCMCGSLLLFLTDVPLAIRATQDVARVGIYKLVVRTLFMGLLFGGSYVVMGTLALRQAR